MRKSKRFGFVLSTADKSVLERLAQLERLSAAAVVRRLVWREAERLGLRNDDARAPNRPNHADHEY